jgi:predicted phosphodiesterase
VRRIAAIADIHGDTRALDADLAEIDREGVDAVVVCRDIGAAVLARLRERPDTHCIRGNADREDRPEEAELQLERQAGRP